MRFIEQSSTTSIWSGTMTRPGEERPRAPHPAELARERRIAREGWCDRVSQAVDDYLHDQCSRKANSLDHCTREGDTRCPCADTADGGVVDLVILIDASGSMEFVAKDVNAMSAAAIKEASAACPSDLRVTWLTVDSENPGTSAPGTGGWAGTQFTQTHEQYLIGTGVTGPFFHNAPNVGSPYSEQGADAIADVSRFFDWRKGACRAIFYISDTTLDAGYQQTSADTAAVANAITEANASHVTVFAHFVVPSVSDNPTGTQADYQALCMQTGGTLYVGPANQGTYLELLKAAICDACGKKCREAYLPDLAPCISVSWGESDCDCMETDDTEVLCITVCNCYSNVTFRNLSIGFLYLTDASGSWVPTLPDGTPSVQIHPVGPICFGDIGPCTEEAVQCVSREVVLTTRGARSGDYQLHVGAVCFDLSVNYTTDDCFKLTLCRD
jgi:hypothetical protein